jgi:hypothetical protein
VDQTVLDPDKQVQQSLRFFFDAFHRAGSAMATIKAFHQQGLLFPRRLKKGPHIGDLLWAELTHSRSCCHQTSAVLRSNPWAAKVSSKTTNAGS